VPRSDDTRNCARIFRFESLPAIVRSQRLSAGFSRYCSVVKVSSVEQVSAPVAIVGVLTEEPLVAIISPDRTHTIANRRGGAIVHYGRNWYHDSRYGAEAWVAGDLCQSSVSHNQRPQASLLVEVFVSNFDPKVFTLELDALGLKLTATRMVDSTIRINQWRMHEYWSNEGRATDLWERTITTNDSNRKLLAEFLLELNYFTF
jgi:hypothetical protein